MSKDTILKVVKTVLPLAIGIYLFWLFFSKMTDEHIASFKRALREANYFWVFVGNDKLICYVVFEKEF